MSIKGDTVHRFGYRMIEMFKLIALVLLTAHTEARRIVGGVDVEIEDYPYQISLEYLSSHNCGGSVLSPLKILTAAHCTIQYSIDSLRVRAGSTRREEGGQVVYLSKKVEHPQYDAQTVNNDVAVLILAQPLQLGPGIKVIKVSDVEDVAAGTYATVTGWGVTETGLRAEVLQMLQMPRGVDAACAEAFGSFYNTTTMVCFGGLPQQDVCSSDSGGPLVIDGKQVGVVSYGDGGCNGRVSAVFTKLHFFRNFISGVN